MNKNAVPDIAHFEVRAGISPSAETAFVHIMKAWSVSDEDARRLLGGVPAEFYEAIKANEPADALSEGQLMRVSYLVGIHKALRILLNDELAAAWMTRPNDNNIFGGMTPVAYCVKEGVSGLAMVRQLLDAQCQGT